MVGKYYVKFDQQMNQEASALMDAWSQGNIDVALQDEVNKLQQAKVGKSEEQTKAIDAKLKELAKAIQAY